MSQVIKKFANGGSAVKEPLLLERENVGKYDTEDLIKRATLGADTWLQSKGIKGAQAQGFKQNLPRLFDAMKAGKVKVLADGRIDTGDTGLSSSGEYDKKKFLGIKTGYKDTENNAFNDIGAYMNSLLAESSPYEAPAPKAKSRYSPNNYISKEISKRWYGGNPVDKKNWFENRSEQDRNTLMSDIVNNADYNSMYDEYDWTDTGVDSAETLGSRLKNFGSAIGNNKLDNEDYNAFATLGGSNLDEWFKQPTKQESTPKVNLREEYAKQLKQQAIESGLVNEQAINAFVEEKLLAQDAKEQTQINTTDKLKQRQATEAYFKDYQTKNPFTPSISGSYVNVEPNYAKKGMYDYFINNNKSVDYFKDLLHKGAFQPSNGQSVVNNFDFLNEVSPNSLVDVGEGFKAIPATYDYNKYSAMAYNPSTKQYKEMSMLANESLKQLVYNHYENPKGTKPKEGRGVGTKFQEGGEIAANLANYRKNKENAQTEEIKLQAKDTNRTPEQVKAGARQPGGITSGNWTGTDYTRLASIVADIGSMGAAYVPGVGTAVSAGLGIGSTLANFGADWAQDGFDGGDLKNLAINLGLDTVGLIPGFGSASKGSKILKTAVRYIPRVLTALAAINYSGPALDSMQKAVSGKDLTMDDWKNIGEGLKLVIQGGRGAKRTIQGAALRYKLNTGNHKLATADGTNVTLTPTQLNEIRSHRRIEDQNAALQLISNNDKLTLAGDLHKRWFNPTRYLPNSNLYNDYDFNKTKSVKTSTGYKEVPIVYSNSDKALVAAMQKNAGGFPGIDKLTTKYNDIKYGKRAVTKPVEAVESVTKPVESITKPKTVPLVVPPVVQPPKPQPMQPKVNAEEVVAKQTIPAHTPIADMFTSTRPVTGAVRANKQKRYEELFSSLPNYQRVGGTPVEKATRPVKPTETPVNKKTYVTSFKAPTPNLPAIVPKPKTQLPMLEKFLPKPQAPEIGKLVNQQIETQSKRLAEQMVSRQTKSGKPIKSVIDANMVKRVPEHARRAKELQATFDAPVEMTKADAAPKVDNEPYVSKNKAKGKTKINSKSKKKSESKGYVNKRAEGGVIALFQGGGSSSILGGTRDVKAKSKFNVVPEDMLSLGRMVSGLTTNNRAAAKYKEGLNPALMNTTENYVPVQGNFHAKNAAYGQASELESMVAKPFTSDASLQLAGKLDATSRAGQMRVQGDAADADMFYRTRLLGQQESDAAKTRRVEVGNHNRVAMNQIDAAKSQIDSARMTANYAQVLAPYIAGVEQQFKQKKAINQQVNLEAAAQGLSSKFDTDYSLAASSAQDRLNKWKMANPSGTDAQYYAGPGKNDYTILKNLQDTYRVDSSKLRNHLASPWLLDRNITSNEKGGKLNKSDKEKIERAKDFNKRLLADNRQFHKDIMESKREHTKLLMSMSGLTSELIKKGMS